MNYKYADSLKLGDTIFIAQSNILYIGFFAGYGRDTIQFYRPGAVTYEKRVADSRSKQFTIKSCCKGYVKEDTWRIAKVENPIFGNKQDEEEYLLAKEILEQIKFIK